MRQRIAVLITLGLMPWVELSAQTTPASTTFRVTTRVDTVCEVTASDLSFGAYNAQGGTPLTGTTLLRTTCTPGSTYNVGLDAGISPGATVQARKMASGANSLNYQLYSDSARSTIWGNTPGTDTVTGVGTGTQVDHTVFGAVPAAQVVPSGDYADTITVRVFY
jgi:spore coat protein U-like protein